MKTNTPFLVAGVGALYEADSLSPPIDWQPGVNQVQFSEGRCRVTVAPGVGDKFFRLFPQAP